MSQFNYDYYPTYSPQNSTLSVVGFNNVNNTAVVMIFKLKIS